MEGVERMNTEEQIKKIDEEVIVDDDPKLQWSELTWEKAKPIVERLMEKNKELLEALSKR